MFAVQDVFDKARTAIEAGKMAEAVTLAEELLATGGDWRCSGLIIAAQAYEEGDAYLKRDLEKSVAMYTEYAILCDDMLPWMFLASALITKGDEHSFVRAAKALNAAAAFGSSPGLDLGWVRYYELRGYPDLESALKYYLSAARAGRFAGFFGAARVLRVLGRPVVACLVDALRFLFGPFIALLIGRKARSLF